MVIFLQITHKKTLHSSPVMAKYVFFLWVQSLICILHFPFACKIKYHYQLTVLKWVSTVRTSVCQRIRLARTIVVTLRIMLSMSTCVFVIYHVAVPCTVEPRYNTVIFRQNIGKIHSIARPWGRVMECILSVQSLIYTSHFSCPCYMTHRVI